MRLGSAGGRDRAVARATDRPDRIRRTNGRAVEHRRRRRRGARRVRRPSLLPELVQAQPAHRHQRRLHRSTSSTSATSRCSNTPRVVLHHRHLPVVHPRTRPAPPLLLLSTLPALRAGGRGPGRGAARAGGRPANCSRSCSRRPTPAARPTSSCWPSSRPSSPTPPNAVLRRKQARQAARAVLPNDTETRIVVTGNYRAWRHFIAMRASEHADVEIRRLAIACLRELATSHPRCSPTSRSPFWPTAARWRPARSLRRCEAGPGNLSAREHQRIRRQRPAGHGSDRDGDAVHARRHAGHCNRRPAGHPTGRRRLRRAGRVGHHRRVARPPPTTRRSRCCAPCSRPSATGPASSPAPAPTTPPTACTWPRPARPRVPTDCSW